MVRFSVRRRGIIQKDDSASVPTTLCNREWKGCQKAWTAYTLVNGSILNDGDTGGKYAIKAIISRK